MASFIYRSELKIWFWAISKLSQFDDLNRLNINNIEPVEIVEFRCFEAAENQNFEFISVYPNGLQDLGCGRPRLFLLPILISFSFPGTFLGNKGYFRSISWLLHKPGLQ